MNKWTGGIDGKSHLGLGGQRDWLGLGRKVMLGQDQRHFRKAVWLYENGPDVYCCHCVEGSTMPLGDTKKPKTQELEASTGHNAVVTD